jgi:hypothetical protein
VSTSEEISTTASCEENSLPEGSEAVATIKDPNQQKTLDVVADDAGEREASGSNAVREPARSQLEHRADQITGRRPLSSRPGGRGADDGDEWDEIRTRSHRLAALKANLAEARNAARVKGLHPTLPAHQPSQIRSNETPRRRDRATSPPHWLRDLFGHSGALARRNASGPALLHRKRTPLSLNNAVSNNPSRAAEKLSAVGEPGESLI